MSSGTEQGKAYALITVDRTDPALPDAQGSASAIARFVTVPGGTDPSRALVAAGATVEVPPADTCQVSGAQEELEAPLPSQGPVEFLEAGDVALAASGAVTPLVPHAFPTVGGFASGVLYATRDRASSALPSAVPYVVSASGSSSVATLHAVADAPATPADVRLAGALLGESSDVHTGHAIELSWAPGKGSDIVYAELLAYDGSPSVLCTFHDEAGAGVIPADAFSGTGTGRIALHRLRSRHFEGATTAPSGDVRFDFQIDAPVEYAK